MRLWLELTQEEGERLFDAVKGFTVDRMTTGVVSAAKDNSGVGVGIGAVSADKVKTAEATEAASREVPANTEDKPEVTLEIVRAVLTEKKRSGKDLKTLFSKFGVSKLSEIAPKDYCSLLQEVEAL